MIINKMFKLILKSLFLYLFFANTIYANEDFNLWLTKFQKRAVIEGRKIYPFSLKKLAK